MSTSRRLLSLLLSLVAAALLVLPGALLAASAALADDTTERSLKFDEDKGWMTTIDQDLFAVNRGEWGPQGRFADIMVRNRSDAPADIDVLIDRAGGTDPSDNPLSFKVQVGEEAWSPIPSVETGLTISLQRVESDGTVVIRLQALLRSSAPPDRQLTPADGTFRISVVKSSPATSMGTGESQGASNLYLAPVFLVVALLLLSALTLRRRLGDRGAT